uniref:Cytochrome b5 heme-binding domain-containing protein n=1 Tax=Pyramimonas obovata TaxID=1411642 RepID=A0A7S0RGV5_9CHLO|mmetsp:Transcript_33807/g.73934  ORF Transcript_33807/g.73934 Transcript_33807/m.73934 type:complete len:136 (+) Transcript_33807:244-651(+)|eukprot:CAMPEP_0118932230 /NCGR_PEP_ID=MMETSP1169-20130426/9538_1 /TAXON_ID=36882 /ORGANISM="Pyramimonas obovata, Strain CCMP722" /LENGTH=135 /DNA_ID=CAMNT_0006874855 /DNA_START=263 /DNA_END=670 /DNA_ORIENTATION=-
MSAEEAKEEKKVYTLEEVEKHTSAESCWIVVEGKVYDVTKYLDDHPGGHDVLLDASGSDATEDFNDVGHSKPAIASMEKYLIGEFAGGSSSKTTKTGGKANQGGLAVLLQFLVPILVAMLVLAVNHGYLANPFQK